MSVLTDEELIKLVFIRAEQSELFCARVIKFCQEYIKQLENE